MHRHMRLLVTALFATAVMVVAVGGASARNLSITSQNIRAAWANLEFLNTANSVTVKCQVTLEASFHSRTLVKRIGSLIGYVTRADLGPCVNGTATISRETLPWHVTYEGFTGTLPDILTVRLLLHGLNLYINDGSNTCQFRTEELQNASFIAVMERGTVGSLRADESRQIQLRGGPFGICALANGFLRGAANVTQLGTVSTLVTVRLI